MDVSWDVVFAASLSASMISSNLAFVVAGSPLRRERLVQADQFVYSSCLISGRFRGSSKCLI